MHPRNPYNVPPDFEKLAEEYPALLPHIIRTSSGPRINFQDLVAQRRLTEALLHRDFGISLTIPENRLCPPVPNRFNYVLWLQDILDATSLALETEEDRSVRGVDIGTGASAIYPLLGCRTNPRWHFVATDIDETSLLCARMNVKRNSLEDRVTVTQVDPNGPILPFEHDATSRVAFDFTMCNPPFYSSREEVFRSAEAKELGPNAVCTGADTEMITVGGESAFVHTIVEESLLNSTRCKWYTSMLGKLSSVADIVGIFRERKIENYAVTEFVQGQTRRWAIGWSFTDIRLPDLLARIPNPALQNLMPSHNTLQQPYTTAKSGQQLNQILNEVLSAIDGISVQPTSEAAHRTSHMSIHPVDFLVHAAGNTWSRAARRKKLAAARGSDLPMEVVTEPESTKLICRIYSSMVEKAASDQPRSNEFSLIFDWVRGKGRSLFESFASHVRRKAEAALTSKEVNMTT